MLKLVLFLVAFVSFHASASIGIESPSGLGKAFLVYSEDPFEGKRTYKHVAIQSYVNVTCNTFSFRGLDGYFNEFSLPAVLKVRINDQDFEFSARYETVGVSQSRYYKVERSADFELFQKLVLAMKKGNSALVGGKWRDDWESKKIPLAGFTKAYNKLDCKS